MSDASGNADRRVRFGVLSVIVGALAAVEFTSGVLQGFYTPMLSDIARHLGVRDADVNWFEGAQLMLSALVVPLFAKLGDALGYKRMLLWGAALTAAASLALPFADSFGAFLVAWTLQGVYVVWLPLNIAIIWSRSRERADASALTARAAGLLIASLQVGAIGGALAGGALIDAAPLRLVLLVPALLTCACVLVVAFGVEGSARRSSNRSASGPAAKLDLMGLTLLSTALIALTGGLGMLRLHGADSPLPWMLSAAGAILLVPFVRYELRHPDPLIDVRMLRSRALAPVLIAVGLLGVGVLGAQAPLSTFLRTDPAVHGLGLGADGLSASFMIATYLIAMAVGALLLPRFVRRIPPRTALIAASCLVGAGFLLFLPFHEHYWQMLVNLCIAGVGAGALLAALPAAAAAAAPDHRTAMAVGLTNTSKTLGGACAAVVFGIALLQGAAGAGEVGAGRAGADAAGSFVGYLAVWSVCGAAAIVCAIVLCALPRDAFTDTARVARVAADSA